MRLDREQLAAARVGGVPARVVAGAGTGKTAVIAERFRRLVESGAPPGSILVMTFTDRAATEMRERIEELIGMPAPAVGTFHALALSWLRSDGRSIGVPSGFRIITGADRWILARELMWELGDAVLTANDRPDDLVAPALQMLERMKQELVPLQKLAVWADSAEDRERAALMVACVRLFRAFERACRKQRLLDFDDLLTLTVRMLVERPAVLQSCRERYPHVLVDEYQDLNLTQERLVELIAGGGAPLVVGDDDQSIYRFRGASRASLDRFAKSFPTANTVTLGRNHRSSRRIVTAAAALIANNPHRLDKQLRADRAGRPVEVWLCPDGITEATAIACEVERLAGTGVPMADIAVLCRTNATARPIADALAARRVPHVVVGGHGFHDRPEIRDVIALLRLLQDPEDAVARARFTERPPALVDSVIESLNRLAATDDVRDVFFELMERTRYLEALAARLEASEAARASANVGRFAELMAEWCEAAVDRSLVAYMRYLDLVLLSGEDESPAEVEGMANAVQVMTIHQAKGLEFDAVFVPGMVEGRLPQSGRSPRFELPPAVLEPLVRGREDVIGEERRLLYVAMTRARRFLYLTRASHYEGGRRWRDSRFLDEVKAAGPRVVVEKGIPASVSAAGVPPPLALPTGEEGDPVILSFSGIATYRDCPRQYWYRYVQRLPAAQSAEAVQGVVLHEVLRRAADLRRQGKSVSASALRALHREVWGSTTFPDARRAPIFERHGSEQLEAYRAQGGLDGRPEFVEQSFETRVDGWTLRGVIDRIDRMDGGWRIIDYKSGRRLTRKRRDLQVELYALGAREALELDPIELQVVYLASGEAVTVDRSEPLMAEARQQGTDVAEGVRSGRFEARPDRRRCRRCPYRLACAEAL